MDNNENIEILIGDENEGARVDLALSLQLPEISSKLSCRWQAGREDRRHRSYEGEIRGSHFGNRVYDR